MTSQVEKTSLLWNEKEKVVSNQSLSPTKSIKRLKSPKKPQDYKKSTNDIKIEDVFLNSEYFKHQGRMSSISFCSGDNGENRWTVNSKSETPFRRKVFKGHGMFSSNLFKSDTAVASEKEKTLKHGLPKGKKLEILEKEAPQVETEKFLDEILSGKDRVDRDLISLITDQMFLAERELQVTRMHLVETMSKLNERDLEILQLHEKIQNLQRMKKLSKIDEKEKGGSESASKTTEDYQRLIIASEKLKKQVNDMEEFLNDYGLVWVGSKDSFHKPDLDKIIQNFQKLNAVAAQPKIIQTTLGAKFEIPRQIPVVLYSNGILIRGKDFREYNKISTNLFLQDVEDGYFPSELQSEFPDGVPFEVVDKRTEVYHPNGKIPVFQGHGNRLGSTFEGKPSSVVYLEPLKQVRGHDSCSTFSQDHSDISSLKKLHKKRSRNGSFHDDSKSNSSSQMTRISRKLDEYQDKKDASGEQFKVKIRFGFSNRTTKHFVLDVSRNRKMHEFQNSLQMKLCELFHEECLLDPLASNYHPTDFEVYVYGSNPVRLSDHLNDYPKDCGIIENCVVNVTEI